MTRVSLTGGTGFIGAALIDQLVAEGFQVRALARDKARVKRGGEIEIVEGDLENSAALASLADGAEIFIHLAGETHARTEQDFTRINVAGAERAATAAAKAGARFLHASSLSARAPETSPYARSKLESEGAIARAAPDGRWITLRLPAIYGPGDLVTLPYFKMLKSGFAFEPATESPARASLLFVEDAASAFIWAMTKGEAGNVYEVEDDAPAGRSWSEIGKVLSSIYGNDAMAIRIPKPAIALIHEGMRAADTIFGRTPSIRQGQVNELFHPDWVARDNLFGGSTGWRAATGLKEGFAKTVRWYQEQGLI
ncbi:MAG: NAD-dependent epimerase/dehydratase family protein [Parvularculaceae bacterium]|nr:NAD-dependent epimerase/dehydratase family protein [Parvularculaceae bacterium]